MKHQLALAAILLSCATSAFAQRGNNFNGNNGNNNRNGNGNNRNGNNRGGGTLPLPEGVDRLVSVDAYNILLAESKDDDNQSILTPIVVRHVYSGGMAALFGGTSIPTEQFVSPGSLSNGGVGGNGGFGVSGFGGNNGFNGGGNGFNQGNQGFNQGFNQGNQGFNQGFNQGNQGFGNQGFNGNFSMNQRGNGVVGFNGSGVNNGFNVAGNGQIFQTPNGGFGTSQTSVLGPNGQQIPLANGPTFVR